MKSVLEGVQECSDKVVTQGSIRAACGYVGMHATVQDGLRRVDVRLCCRGDQFGAEHGEVEPVQPKNE